MIVALSYMTFGFFLGMRHATDADHVAAVSTIVARQRTVRAGLVIGAVWGLGHTLTIVVVGGAIVLFRVVIPPMLGLTMEMSVALMLVALGMLNLRALRPADHRRRDGGDAHAYGSQLLRPLLVGVVHGLAGSAAVALLVIATISEAGSAMAYLVLFGGGTIMGMALITAGLAVPLAYASRRSGRLQQRLRTASGLMSVGVGLVLVYQIGFVEGLFTGATGWTPR